MRELPRVARAHGCLGLRVEELAQRGAECPVREARDE